MVTDLNLVISANPATTQCRTCSSTRWARRHPSERSVACDRVDDAAITSDAIRGLEANKTGFYALDDVDLFNILCIPAAAKLDATSLQAVVSEGTAYCTLHRAMFILDIPRRVNGVAQMQTWMSLNDSLRKPTGGLFSRLRIPDPLNGNGCGTWRRAVRWRVFGGNGCVRGVWKAPAAWKSSS